MLIRTALPGDRRRQEAATSKPPSTASSIACIYLPNGNPQPGPKFDYKLDWFRRLQPHAAKFIKQDVPVVLAGDYNVAPTPLDIYPTQVVGQGRADPAEEPRGIQAADGAGLADAIRTLHPDEPMYTFWDYKRKRWPRDAGLRLDHLLLSPVAGAAPLQSRRRPQAARRGRRQRPRAGMDRAALGPDPTRLAARSDLRCDPGRKKSAGEPNDAEPDACAGVHRDIRPYSCAAQPWRRPSPPRPTAVSATMRPPPARPCRARAAARPKSTPPR